MQWLVGKKKKIVLAKGSHLVLVGIIVLFFSALELLQSSDKLDFTYVVSIA